VNLSQSSLAELVGGRRTSVNRVLKSLEEQNLVRARYGQVWSSSLTRPGSPGSPASSEPGDPPVAKGALTGMGDGGAMFGRTLSMEADGGVPFATREEALERCVRCRNG
jgi:hypothetical protein